MAQRTSSNEFTHIVLTRFNVAIGYASAGKGIESSWLEERLALFMQYCFPTVSRQQGVAHRWVVLCNALSPEWFKEKMASLAGLTPVYVSGVATDEIIAQKVRETGLVTTPYLITTRIDNDDSLSRSHLYFVQRAFLRQQREFLVFPIGLQSFRGHLYQTYWPDNPFLSLIEKVRDDGSFTTVFCVPHTDVHTAGKVRRLWHSPQWLQVIHGNNVGNTLQAWPRIRSRAHPNFDLAWPQDVPADTFPQRANFALTQVRNRALRVLGRLKARAVGGA
ncbi:MAG TPA: glycosyltransferase [Acidobacteriaceae bacterium]|jgi:hypothetical protein